MDMSLPCDVLQVIVWRFIIIGTYLEMQQYRILFYLCQFSLWLSNISPKVLQKAENKMQLGHLKIN